MKKLLILACIVGCNLLHAQTTTEEVRKSNQEEAFATPETMPEFPGGSDSLAHFIRKHLVYPREAMDYGIEGKVYISFIVNTDGTVSDIKIKKGIGGGCDEEALRVIKLMPKWKPGSLNGKPVMVSFILPISFTLR